MPWGFSTQFMGTIVTVNALCFRDPVLKATVILPSFMSSDPPN